MYYGTHTAHLHYMLARVISSIHNASEMQLPPKKGQVSVGAATVAVCRCLGQGMRKAFIHWGCPCQRDFRPLCNLFPHQPPESISLVGTWPIQHVSIAFHRQGVHAETEDEPRSVFCPGPQHTANLLSFSSRNCQEDLGRWIVICPREIWQWCQRECSNPLINFIWC